MVEEISKRYPGASLWNYPDNSLYDLFVVILENKWSLSVGYGPRHSSSNRGWPLDEFTDADRVEIAIFRPSHEWFVTEGMETFDGGETGTLNYQDSDQLFRILEYVNGMEAEQCPGTSGSPWPYSLSSSSES